MHDVEVRGEDDGGTSTRSTSPGRYVAYRVGGDLEPRALHLTANQGRPLLLVLGDRPLTAFVVGQVLIQDLTAQFALHRFRDERGELTLADPSADRLRRPRREGEADPGSRPFAAAVRNLTHGIAIIK